MEKIVHIQLYSYLNENNLITSEQFGFRPTLSTGLALTQFTDSILGDMDAGRFTGAVFLDLSKAFDTVDHAILLDNLRSLGVDEVLSSGSDLTYPKEVKLHQLVTVFHLLCQCLLESLRESYSGRCFLLCI